MLGDGNEFFNNCLSSTARTLATIEETDEEKTVKTVISVDRNKIFAPTVKVNASAVIQVKLRNYGNTNHVLKVEGFSQYFSSNHCQV